KAQGQPRASMMRGTAWIVAIVRRKPSEVWSVSAVPTESGAAVSVTIAENCAESETTKKPQMRAAPIRTQGLPEKRAPTISEQPPLTAIETLTTNGRPRRSATQPPHKDPSAPEAIAAKATASAACAPRERSDEAARNAGIQVHIAYSSHMCPR